MRPPLNLVALACLVLAAPAQADEIDALAQVLGNPVTSPVPQGWTLGGVMYSGSSAYSAGETSTMAIPGGIYLGDKGVMYLGDRIYADLAKQGPVTVYGRLRVRLGNLDPADSPAWTGMTPRKGQLEAALGAVWVTPVGLLSARMSSDVSGRSKGSEGLLMWSVPLVGERWMVMPSLGTFWRSSKLANYYFGGVSEAEAAPGRPAYDVGDAWSLSPALIASYRVAPQWLVGAVFSGDIFSDAIRNSPLVQKRWRYDALIGVGYIWR
jgi:outer membrane protein